MNTRKDALLADARLGVPGYELKDYVAEAIEFLRANEPPEGYYVGFSGGKDSITTLAICRMAGIKHFPYYSCTTIDPPEVVQFIRRNYPEIPWLRPKDSFWNFIVKKAPPTQNRRWCCDLLKKEPSRKIKLNNRVMGIRAEESTKRAGRPRISALGKGKSAMVHVKPIFHWPEWAIWEFIEKYGLAYPSLYDEGWHRVGCVCCPFIFGTAQVTINQRKWPGLWRAFRHAADRYFTIKFSDLIPPDQLQAYLDEHWRRYIKCAGAGQEGHMGEFIDELLSRRKDKGLFR